jgi:enamine deaminase RidA (YjgF/YER057c/UK114 family)
MPAIRKINVPGVGRLPAFCHATVAGNQVFASGMRGAREDALELVPGGVAAQTTQALRKIQVILGRTAGVARADAARHALNTVTPGQAH